jgi:hypothetical protein
VILLPEFAAVSEKKTDRREFLKRSAAELTIPPLAAVAADHGLR